MAVALTHPPTRAGLRRRWQWALLETTAGGLILAPVVAFGPDRQHLVLVIRPPTDSWRERYAEAIAASTGTP